MFVYEMTLVLTCISPASVKENVLLISEGKKNIKGSSDLKSIGNDFLKIA